MWIPSSATRRHEFLVSRRWFLGVGAATVTGLMLPGCGDSSTNAGKKARSGASVSAGPKGVILGAGREKNVKTDELRYWLTFVDLDVDPPKTLQMALPFFAHGLVPHPIHRERLAVFEKRGKGACEVDLSKGVITRMIGTVESREFYGHGAFSADGKIMYATESDVDDGYRGVVAIRDPETMRLTGEFPSFGTAPHDCHLVDGGRTMVITNGGDPLGGKNAPSVTFIDVVKKRMIDKIVFDTPSINAGHVAISSAGDVAVVSAPREGESTGTGALTLRPEGEAAVTVVEPKDVTAKMKLESLSVSIHEPSGTVGVTNPAGDIVTFWGLRTREFKGSYEVEGPKGIVLTEAGDEFIVSSGKSDPFLTRISVETLKPVSGAETISCAISGSHLINYRFDA